MIESVEKRGNSLVICLSGSLEVSLQARLKESLSREMTETAAKNILLDLSKVNFIDSACLGVLVALKRKIQNEDRALLLAAPPDEVRSIFQITRLDKIFSIYDSKTEALEALSS